MLQAWIASPSGSLYFAAEATSCNLQDLRDHLRGMRHFDSKAVRLSLSVDADDDARVVAEVTELLDRVAAEGVLVTFAVAPGGTREQRIPDTRPLGRSWARQHSFALPR